jgi:4-hydroxymandelate oxidase
MAPLLNLTDYEVAAREQMSQMAFDYYFGGSDDEVTLRDNRRCFEQWLLRPRMLSGVSQPDLTTTALGTTIALPVILAPTGYHQLAHPEGERATARAAADAGTIMCVSTLATTSLEDVAAASDGPKWFQVYVFKDRELARDMVQRAAAAGYRALVLTVDVPGVSRRERDMRNGFSLPEGMAMRNLSDEALSHFPAAAGSGLTAFVSQQFDPALTWDAIGWLRDIADLPVLVKGILTGEDARLAVENGADGVIVSNHGGRQLDSTLSGIDALPEVVDAAGDAIEIYMDGGVRRGTDVLKALALGARAVLIGRPALWGLAACGEAGVRHVLQLLGDEIEMDMRLCGQPDVKRLTRSLLMRNPRYAG